MWNEDKQQRLDRLRIREADGSLTETQRAEMETLFGELDAEEATALRPAMQRMQRRQAALRAEKEQLAAEAAQLERIARAQEELLADACSYLDQLRARRAELAD